MKSWLFTPATKPERFSKASEVHADVIILDLEDAVAPAQKIEARHHALQAIQTLKKDIKVAVRINNVASKIGFEDFITFLQAKHVPHYLILPKSDSAVITRFLQKLISDYNKNISIIPMIESNDGLESLKMYQDKEVEFVLYGAADMSADLMVSEDSQTLKTIESEIIQYANQQQIAVIASPYFDINNLDGLKSSTQMYKDNGYSCRAVIHPNHVDTVNSIFSPTDEEIIWAQQILEINTLGVGRHNGQMVDEAIARRARHILNMK